MEIIIAILWYLQLIFIGGSYTEEQINTLVFQNQPAIEAVQSNGELMNQVLDSYQQALTNQSDVLEQWKDPLPEPIRK